MSGRKPAGRFSPDALAVRVVVWAGAAALCYLGVFCLAGSSNGSGHSYRVSPLFPVQLAALLLLAWLAGGVFRRGPAGKARAKRRLDLACALVCLWCFGLAVAWGLQGDFTPRFIDMANIRQLAIDLTQNRYDLLAEEYFIRYPYQLGTALYFAALFRLFGTGLPVVVVSNACWVALCVYCGYRIVGRISPEDRRPQAAFLLLAAACLQPVLYAPLSYSDLPGTGCMFLAVWWAVRLGTEGRLRYLWGLSAVLTAGTLIRSTMLITALAVLLAAGAAGLGALFSTASAKEKAKKVLPAAVLAVVFCVCLNSDLLLSRYMQFRAGITLPPGLPKSNWLVMGTKESSRGCGWYEGWTDWLCENVYGDMELADVKSRIELGRQYEKFAKDPRMAARFFHCKLMSQWGDPTLQSLAACYYVGCDIALGNDQMTGTPFLVSVYNGGLYPAAIAWMDLHQSLVYLAALAWLVWLGLGRGQRGRPHVCLLLPVIVFLGGFFFYLVWEAQGRYCLPFFLMLLPAAACGVPVLAGAVRTAAGRLLKNRKAAPPAIK